MGSLVKLGLLEILAPKEKRESRVLLEFLVEMVLLG